jgi:hypothetical protein
MPAPTYTVPSANSDTATEEPKIITALTEIKALLNAGLDEDNFDPGATWPPSRINNGSSGQLLIASASGIWTARDVTGDVTVGPTGVTAIGADKVTNTQLKDDASTDSNRAVTRDHIRDNAINQAKLDDDSVGDDQLISPPNEWRDVDSWTGRFAASTSGFRLFRGDGTMPEDGTSDPEAVNLISFPDDVYDRDGKDTKLRFILICVSNVVFPNNGTLTFGLRLVDSIGGGSDVLNIGTSPEVTITKSIAAGSTQSFIHKSSAQDLPTGPDGGELDMWAPFVGLTGVGTGGNQRVSFSLRCQVSNV